jgi:hypothetical protein
MKTLYLTPTDTAAQPAIRLMKQAYPSYAGRQFKLRLTDRPINVCSYWEGGSRSYYTFVNLDTGAISPEVPQQSAFDARIPGADSVTLPPGAGCVEHSIFCGKDYGLTLILRAENATKFLPDTGPALTDDEVTCLRLTASLKNTYAGRTNIRQAESGLSLDAWRAVQTGLITRKLLRKNGSITPAGSNHVTGM